jgi:flagellar motor switch protein FliG
MLALQTGIEKAAAMMVCIGLEKSAQVLTHLSLDDVEVLSDQMARVGYINREAREELIGELQARYHGAVSQGATGDLSFVRRMLTQTFGEDRANMVLEQLTQPKATRPFQTLRSVDAPRILEVLSSEHPGVIAVVLYFLPRDKAAMILAGLADAVRLEVVMRVANMQTPVPNMVARLEQLLNQKLSQNTGDKQDDERDLKGKSGARTLVEILSRTDPGVERRVYESLQERDPSLAEEVRKSMFVFEDLVKLDSVALQLVFREVPNQELALALKSAPDMLRDLVFANVSANSAKMIREELDLLGPVRASQVEQAQEKVVGVVRMLSDAGSIDLRAGEDDDRMV